MATTASVPRPLRTCVSVAFRLREKPNTHGAVAVKAPAAASMTPCTGNGMDLTAPKGYFVKRLSPSTPNPEMTAFVVALLLRLKPKSHGAAINIAAEA